MEDGAGGDAGEDALQLDELADPAYGVTGADRERQWMRRRVGTKPSFEVAQTCSNELAVARLRRDDPNARAWPCGRSGETPMRVPAAPSPATKCVIDGRSASSSGSGALFVRERVGVVAVLVEHHPVGVLG